MSTMADDYTRVLGVVYAAVDELNAQRRRSERIQKSPSTAIAGAATELDSIGLLTLLVQTEHGIEREFGATVTLSDAEEDGHRPLESLQALVEEVCSLLEKKRNE